MHSFFTRFVHLVCNLLCCVMLLSCSRQITPDSSAPTNLVDGWVLLVDTAGPYWLGADWWKMLGMDIATLGYNNVRLQKDSADIPYLWVENEKEVGLLFYADVASTREGKWGGYTLQIGEPGLRMPLFEPAISSVGACQDTTLENVIYEENNQYRSTAPMDYPWLWISQRPPENIQLTIPLTRSVAGPITITTQMWGQSRMPQNPDHHIRLIWDTTQISDHFWDGNGIELWDTIFFAENQQTTDLVIASPGETDAPVEVNWLDTLSVTWRKSLVWSGMGWERWYAEDESEVCWQNKTNDKLTGILISTDGKIYQADTTDARIPQANDMVGWIGIPQLASIPAFIRQRDRVDPVDLLDIDYLVIAPKSFQNNLTPLLEKRTREGLSTYILSPEQIYDTFGHGIVEESAITTMVNILAYEGQLHYLLLVGDTTTGASLTPEESLMRIPTGWVQTTIVGDTPSDFLLVNDGKGKPMVAVGRFPATNEADVAQMVAKTLNWTPVSRLIFVEDDEVEFESFVNRLADVSPSYDRLRAGDEDARKTLLSWLREGPGIMVYSGHGSLPMLGDEKILTQEDAGQWDGPTVVIAWSCLCATFTHQTYQGLGESWMKSDMGTVAFVGPTGETTSSQQDAMAIAVQKSLLDGQRIGDALLAGWEAAYSNDVRVSFLLLGDPALRPFTGINE